MQTQGVNLLQFRCNHIILVENDDEIYFCETGKWTDKGWIIKQNV